MKLFDKLKEICAKKIDTYLYGESSEPQIEETNKATNEADKEKLFCLDDIHFIRVVNNGIISIKPFIVNNEGTRIKNILTDEVLDCCRPITKTGNCTDYTPIIGTVEGNYGHVQDVAVEHSIGRQESIMKYYGTFPIEPGRSNTQAKPISLGVIQEAITSAEKYCQKEYNMSVLREETKQF